MEFDEARVDEIKNELLSKGYSWTQANSMAVDAYIHEHLLKLQQERKSAIIKQANEDRRPMNTANRKRTMRPTQTSWRTAHANV